jgi:hypothetical protein
MYLYKAKNKKPNHIFQLQKFNKFGEYMFFFM